MAVYIRKPNEIYYAMISCHFPANVKNKLSTFLLIPVTVTSFEVEYLPLKIGRFDQIYLAYLSYIGLPCVLKFINTIFKIQINFFLLRFVIFDTGCFVSLSFLHYNALSRDIP